MGFCLASERSATPGSFCHLVLVPKEYPRTKTSIPLNMLSPVFGTTCNNGGRIWRGEMGQLTKRRGFLVWGQASAEATVVRSSLYLPEVGFLWSGISVAQELQGLEALEYQMSRNLEALRERRETARFNRTFKGRAFNVMGRIFTIYCIMRVFSVGGVFSCFCSPLTHSSNSRFTTFCSLRVARLRQQRTLILSRTCWRIFSPAFIPAVR